MPADAALTRRLSKRVSDTAVALADQAVVSGASFLASVQIGRACSAEEFGLFALANTLLISAMALEEALITFPYMMSHEPGAANTQLRAGQSLLHCALFCALLSLLALIATAGTALAILVLTLPAVLMREFVRRFCFAHLKPGAALVLDAAVGVLQTGLLCIFQRTGTLSALSALMVLAVSSALPCLIWLARSRSAFAPAVSELARSMRRDWRIGRWFLVGKATELFQTSAATWATSVFLGTAATGHLAAAVSAAMISRPFVMGLGNLLTPRAMAALRAGDRTGLLRQIVTDALMLAVLMLVFCTLMAAEGPLLLRLMFGRGAYEDQAGNALFIAIGLFIYACGMPSSNALLYVGKPRPFAALCVSAFIITAIASCLMTLIWGLPGAAASFAVGAFVTVAGRWLGFLYFTRGET